MKNSFAMRCRPLAFLCLFLFACVGSSGAKNARLWEYRKDHFNLYSLKDEISIGEHYFQRQKAEFASKNVTANPESQKELLSRIEGIVHKLAKVSDNPQLPYEVVLFDKRDVVNAFCLPGGKIAVFTGLFDQELGLVDAKKDDEIAAVLGHEIAHATLRHVTRTLTAYSGFQLVGGLVATGVGGAAGQNWGDITAQVFSTGGQLYFPTYSRKHEREADKVGLYYMVKAGFNPQAAIDVWERAALRAAAKGKGARTHFFDTHPASGERAQNLRSYYQDALQLRERP